MCGKKLVVSLATALSHNGNVSKSMLDCKLSFVALSCPAIATLEQVGR